MVITGEPPGVRRRSAPREGEQITGEPPGVSRRSAPRARARLAFASQEHVEEVREGLKGLGQKVDMDFTAPEDNDIPPTLMVNRRRIQPAVGNVLANGRGKEERGLEHDSNLRAQ